MDTSLTDNPTGKSHALKSSLMYKNITSYIYTKYLGIIPGIVATLLPPSTLPVQKLLFISQSKKFHVFYTNQNSLYPQQQSATQHAHMLLV
jgi:hypothetical protein